MQVVKNEAAITKEVAIAMRDCWCKIANEGEWVPFEKSDKKAIWLKMAAEGIKAYKRMTV